ncbi:MAG: PEP-utilizing enzyme [Acidimicrobiia bacterium]|nr:PEP-utilizing enzyme [Acidimicrobiia bacterium]
MLDGAGASPSLIGGKAAALDRVLGAGMPVPPIGAVTTAAYRRFVTEGGLGPLLDALRGAPVPSPAEAGRARRIVDEAFLGAPMATDIETAIAELGRVLADDGRLAVRSSATAEDLRTASFAGQYSTSLDVAPDDVVEAVRRCWASLWHPTPRAYRRFRSIDETDVAMAALVMPMLRPSHAGVLFTEDPADPGSVRIEVVEGLGEALVSGARTPQVVVVPRADAHSFRPDLAALAPLVGMALRLETEFGTALDVEWAVEDGRSVILQARPITTTRAGPTGGPIDEGREEGFDGRHEKGRDTGRGDAFDDGFDVCGGPQRRYTTAGIAEMLPGVLPPRLWDLDAWLVDEAMRTLFRDLGATTGNLGGQHALIARFRGRAALDLDLMEQIVDSVPGGSRTELEHQYFGTGPAEGADADDGHRAGLVQGLRALRLRGRAFERAEVAIGAVDLLLDAEPDLDALEDGALLALRARVGHLACRATEAEVAVAAVATAGYRGLERFLRRHLARDTATELLARLTTIDHAVHRDHDTAALAPTLAAVSRRLHDDPAFAPVAAEPSFTRARERLGGTKAGRALLDELTHSLQRAGSMAVYGGPTWDAAPEQAWPMLRRAPARIPTGEPQAARSEALAEAERLIRSDRRWRHARAVSLQVLDVRTRFLRREASDAAAFLEQRERAKAALLRLGGVQWRIDRECGRRLATRGALESVEDVDLVTGAELERLLAGEPARPDVVAFRRRRRAAMEAEPALPLAFRGRPEAATDRPADVTGVAGPFPGGDRFVGWACSPGRHEGPAAVVDSPEHATLRRGDVLVARTTDASWLPLFHVAGAAVVEEGGPLSHASILARELGVPAVLNVPGIVDRVRRHPGAVLRVDGTAGEVELLPSPAHGERLDPQEPPVPGGPGSGGGPAAGTAPLRRVPPDIEDPATPTAVFVTGLIGAGAVMSVVVGLAQSIGDAATQRRTRLRARPRAEALAAGVVHGFTASSVGAAGLRPRGYFAWLAGCATVLAVVVASVAADDYLEDPSAPGGLVPFGLAAPGVVALLTVALLTLAAVVRWPAVPPAARRASLPRVHDLSPTRLVGPVHAPVVAALWLVVLALAWAVAEAEPALREVDRRILDAIGAGADRRAWHPGVLDDVFRKEVMIPLAVALTLATFRCRPLRTVYPAVIAAGGAAHLALAYFLVRARPGIGPKPGVTDSFPGGRVNELTIMAGLVPLVLYVLTGSRRLHRLLAVACTAVLALLVVDAVRLADHWPSDNLAGLAIGASMVVVAYGVAFAPALHTGCRDCPAARRLREPAADRFETEDRREGKGGLSG